MEENPAAFPRARRWLAFRPALIRSALIRSALTRSALTRSALTRPGTVIRGLVMHRLVSGWRWPEAILRRLAVLTREAGSSDPLWALGQTGIPSQPGVMRGPGALGRPGTRPASGVLGRIRRPPASVFAHAEAPLVTGWPAGRPVARSASRAA